YIPWIGSLITPITIFIATVYVCSRLAAHTEIIAMLSAGISFKRTLVPYFIGALIVASISFVLNGWIIPDSNKSRLAFELQYLQNKYYFNQRNIHMQVAPETYMYMQSYQNITRTGYHFTLEHFDNNRLVEKLTANRITWDSVKQKWTLYEWKLKRIDSVFEASLRRTSSDNAEGMVPVTTGAPRPSEQSGKSLDTALV